MLPYIVVTTLTLAVVLYTEMLQARNAIGGQAGSLGPSAKVTLIVGTIAKTLASAAFIACAIAADAFSTVAGQMLFIALVWSFLGDVLLVFKGSRPAFIFGIAAFLMAHLGYVMLFRVRGLELTSVLIGLAVFGVFAFFIWRVLSRHVQGGMRVAVGAYIAVITLMVATSVSTSLVVVGPDIFEQALPFVAAFLFWVSDLTVARQRFVQQSMWNRVIGLPLYYAAQYLFIALAT